ncbi:hypothetical protein [Cellulomonas sp. NS3]|uniref:hypothetical protein n=1 Tax=Cellulomonas sp. NS3 TaxID=2973977 RepID=UPI002161EEB5|nr:hypothetical protein [Cellulomonas sp. NS3]
MTAIDGSTFDLFDDFTSGDAAQRAASRLSSLRRLAVVLTAGALVVSGAVGARAALDARSTEPVVVAPAVLFGVLAERQRDADVLAEEPGTALLDPASTRFLGETTAGSHYLAVHATGLVCLVTVPVGEVAEVGCTDPVASDHLLRAEHTSPVPLTLALVPDGLAPAADGAPWERLSANLYVRDGVSSHS